MPDSAKKVALKNSNADSVTTVRFDDCVVKDTTAADFLVGFNGDVQAIIELKGRNIEHALEQIYATATWLKQHGHRLQGKTGAISCKQVPSAGGNIQKKRERLRVDFGLRTEISSSKYVIDLKSMRFVDS